MAKLLPVDKALPDEEDQRPDAPCGRRGLGV